jgi:hypothetical protein
VALGEWASGTQLKRAFTVNEYRSIYRGHMEAMQKIRNAEKGDAKYARMLSKIYTLTM